MPHRRRGSGRAALPTVDVVEFYNASLDHYFITWIAAEIANLDAGVTPTRWMRTGYTFKAYATPQAGTSQMCRFYIPPVDGSSHFFGRNAAECDATKQQHPEFVLEDRELHAAVRAGRGCVPGRIDRDLPAVQQPRRTRITATSRTASRATR